MESDDFLITHVNRFTDKYHDLLVKDVLALNITNKSSEIIYRLTAFHIHALFEAEHLYIHKNWISRLFYKIKMFRSFNTAVQSLYAALKISKDAEKLQRCCHLGPGSYCTFLKTSNNNPCICIHSGHEDRCYAFRKPDPK